VGAGTSSSRAARADCLGVILACTTAQVLVEGGRWRSRVAGEGEGGSKRGSATHLPEATPPGPSSLDSAEEPPGSVDAACGSCSYSSLVLVLDPGHNQLGDRLIGSEGRGRRRGRSRLRSTCTRLFQRNRPSTLDPRPSTFTFRLPRPRLSPRHCEPATAADPGRHVGGGEGPGTGRRLQIQRDGIRQCPRPAGQVRLGRWIEFACRGRTSTRRIRAACTCGSASTVTTKDRREVGVAGVTVTALTRPGSSV